MTVISHHGSTYRQVYQWIHPSRFWYLLLFLLSFVSVPLSLLAPIPMMIAVDYVLSDMPVPYWLGWLIPSHGLESTSILLIIAVTLSCVIVILQQLDQYGNWLLQTHIGEKVSLDLKTRFLQSWFRSPFEKNQNISSGEVLYRLESDIPSVTYIPVQWVIISSSALILLAMLWVMIQLYWPFAVISSSVIPLIYAVLKVYQPRARASWLKVKNKEGQYLNTIKDSLSKVPLIQAYQVENYKTNELKEDGDLVRIQKMKAIGVESLFGGGVAIILGFGSALILYLGVIQVKGGHLTIGELILVMGYLVQFYKPLEHLAKKTGELQSAYASVDRILAITELAMKPCPPETLAKPSKDQRAVGLELKNIYYSYPNGKAVLRDLNLTIKAGEHIGITGASGSGKTTLMRIILGFLKAQKGQVLLDGHDNWPLDEYRRMVGIVFQETLLFQESIRSNLIMGKSGLEGNFREAIEKSYAKEFIDELRDGINTQLDEDAHNLSGGQRQRLSLARAFLREYPILILDEPTVGIDRDSSRKIITALGQCSQSLIIVSHDHDILSICDRILALKDGVLSEAS